MCRDCMNACHRSWNARTGKRREITARWKRNNPEGLRESQRRQRKANPEKFKAKYRRQYAANSEKRAAEAQTRRDKDRNAYNASVRLRRASDPAKNRAACQKRRVALRAIPGSVLAADIRAQLIMQGACCYYCRRELGTSYEVDHFVPLAAGGLHDPSNIVIACSGCNRRKNKFDGFALFRKLGIAIEPLRRAA